MTQNEESIIKIVCDSCNMVTHRLNLPIVASLQFCVTCLFSWIHHQITVDKVTCSYTNTLILLGVKTTRQQVVSSH